MSTLSGFTWLAFPQHWRNPLTKPMVDSGLSDSMNPMTMSATRFIWQGMGETAYHSERQNPDGNDHNRNDAMAKTKGGGVFV